MGYLQKAKTNRIIKCVQTNVLHSSMNTSIGVGILMSMIYINITYLLSFASRCCVTYSLLRQRMCCECIIRFKDWSQCKRQKDILSGHGPVLMANRVFLELTF